MRSAREALGTGEPSLPIVTIARSMLLPRFISAEMRPALKGRFAASSSAVVSWTPSSVVVTPANVYAGVAGLAT